MNVAEETNVYPYILYGAEDIILYKCNKDLQQKTNGRAYYIYID